MRKAELNLKTVIRWGVGVFCLLFTLLVTLLALSYFQAQTVFAQVTTPPFNIDYKDLKKEDGSLKMTIGITENSDTPVGPATEASDVNSRKYVWMGYFYEYVASSAFSCRADIAVGLKDVTDTDEITRWMTPRGLTTEWERQQDVFKHALSPRFLVSSTQANYVEVIDTARSLAELPARFTTTSGNSKLAYCLLVLRANGDDATINNVVIDLNDLSTFQTGVELSTDALHGNSPSNSGSNSGANNGGSAEPAPANTGSSGSDDAAGAGSSSSDAASSESADSGTTPPEVTDTATFSDNSLNTAFLILTALILLTASGLVGWQSLHRWRRQKYFRERP